MANIVITAVSGQVYYKLDFGVYSNTEGSSLFFWKEQIQYVERQENTKVLITLEGRRPLIVSFENGDKAMIVDSVLGVTPITTDDQLATLLANIKG